MAFLKILNCKLTNNDYISNFVKLENIGKPIIYRYCNLQRIERVFMKSLSRFMSRSNVI